MVDDSKDMTMTIKVYVKEEEDDFGVVKLLTVCFKDCEMQEKVATKDVVSGFIEFHRPVLKREVGAIIAILDKYR